MEIDKIENYKLVTIRVILVWAKAVNYNQEEERGGKVLKIPLQNFLDKNLNKDTIVDLLFYLKEKGSINLIPVDQGNSIVNLFTKKIFHKQKYIHIIPDLNKLKLEFAELSDEDKKNLINEKIKIIEVGENNEFYCNKDYSSPFIPRDRSGGNKAWNTIKNIANGEYCKTDSKIIKYFNNASLGNPIYTNLGYIETKILRSDKGEIKSAKNIIIATINDERINRRKGQKKKG